MNNPLVFEMVSFVCLVCKYNQDTDPSQPYQQSDEMFPAVPLRMCPNCYATGNEHELIRHTDTDEGSRTQIKVASDTELEEQEVPELDANGQPVMVQTGSRWELAVNQSNGAVTSVDIPIMEPKMRSLTTQELAELKQQRDQNLDALESIAVKEVSG